MVQRQSRFLAEQSGLYAMELFALPRRRICSDWRKVSRQLWPPGNFPKYRAGQAWVQAVCTMSEFRTQFGNCTYLPTTIQPAAVPPKEPALAISTKVVACSLGSH